MLNRHKKFESKPSKSERWELIWFTHRSHKTFRNWCTRDFWKWKQNWKQENCWEVQLRSSSLSQLYAAKRLLFSSPSEDLRVILWREQKKVSELGAGVTRNWIIPLAWNTETKIKEIGKFEDGKTRWNKEKFQKANY